MKYFPGKSGKRLPRPSWKTLDDALAAFIQTSGSSVRLIGVLVRDTPASESDVSTRGKALGEKVSTPGSVELHAMYMPKPMAQWIEWVTYD